MTKDEIQKVRDALWLPENSTDEEFNQMNEALAILDAALAAEPQQPVAWVSVDDAMPKSGVTVLACYKNSHGNLRRIRAKWVAAKTEELNAEHDWGDYDEETDTYWTPEGWYECIDNWDEFSSIMVSEGEITHWMPLPLAPDDPLYTAPVAAQREWQGLGGDKSIEEMIVAGGFWDCLVDDLEPLEGYQSMSAEQDAKNTLVRLVRSIDAALKEKNHG